MIAILEGFVLFVINSIPDTPDTLYVFQMIFAVINEHLVVAIEEFVTDTISRHF
jgi:hypothetical protein